MNLFATHGTTTIESKSGYGLEWKSELKILSLLSELHQEHPLDIHSMFLGAHVVPAEFRDDRKDYVELVTGPMLAACAPFARWIDVFCDRGAFDVDESRIDKRIATGYCDVKAATLDEGLALVEEARAERRALSVAVVMNAAPALEELGRRGVRVDVLTDQTSAHDMLRGYIPDGMSLGEAAALR